MGAFFPGRYVRNRETVKGVKGGKERASAAGIYTGRTGKVRKRKVLVAAREITIMAMHGACGRRVMATG